MTPKIAQMEMLARAILISSWFGMYVEFAVLKEQYGAAWCAAK